MQDLKPKILTRFGTKSELFFQAPRGPEQLRDSQVLRPADGQGFSSAFPSTKYDLSPGVNPKLWRMSFFPGGASAARGQARDLELHVGLG